MSPSWFLEALGTSHGWGFPSFVFSEYGHVYFWDIVTLLIAQVYYDFQVPKACFRGSSDFGGQKATSDKFSGHYEFDSRWQRNVR